MIIMRNYIKFNGYKFVEEDLNIKDIIISEDKVILLKSDLIIMI